MPTSTKAARARRLTILGSAAALALIAAGLWYLRPAVDRDTFDRPSPVAAHAPARAPRVIRFSDKPQPLPAMTLEDLEGRPILAADWRGKVVLVNFWATWCLPCRREIPDLVALQEKYPDQVRVVGLSVDQGGVDEVRAFAREYKVNYAVAMAGPEVQSAFGGILAIPMTFVVDPEGWIVQRHVGLVSPQLVELEVRALAGLPVDATIERVEDTGQVLLANAAHATEIPGVDLSALTGGQKETALQRLNTEHCTCGCGLTIAQCRIDDPGCTVSLPLAREVVKDVAGGGS